jgi:hypothetical protein
MLKITKRIIDHHIIRLHIFRTGSRESVVNIATSYGLWDQGVGVRVPVGQEFPLFQVVQNGSGVHPTFYPMGTRGLFSRG